VSAQTPSTTVAAELEELERTRHELARLEAELAARQGEHEDLLGMVDDVCRRYNARLGGLHRQLESVREETRAILENWHSGRAPGAAAGYESPSPSPSPSAANASAQTASTAHAAQLADEPAPVLPPAPLRQTYRQAASLIHPDRAHDDADRQLRDMLMAQVNAAYVEGDAAAIEDIVSRYRERLLPPPSRDVPSQLARVRQALLRERLRREELERSIAALRESPWSRLQSQVAGAQARGEDPFEPLAQRYAAQIREEQARLEVLAAAARGEAEPRNLGATAAPRAAMAEAAGVDTLICCTRRGDRVASPAEVFIANALFELGLDYKYRYPIGGGSASAGVIHPCFVIFDASLRPIIWEHLDAAGRTAGADWEERRAWYQANDFVEGRTLFVTRERDFSEGNWQILRDVAEHLRILVGVLNLRVSHGSTPFVTPPYTSPVFP
jgi:hypothetical protein